ncbi:MAG TPA: PPC domain-containing protein [Actinomycetota bacterium]|jgi:hypothetical protein|nr:PPC domain-containing protein [Actinomycetota bacterium]
MKSARVFLLAAALICTVTASTAQAATPAQGTLSKKVKVVKWSGTFTLSEPNPAGNCLGGSEDPACDYFYLKVDLPDGARIRIDLPAPSATTDLDLYVHSPTGTEMGVSGNLPGQNEFIEFRHSGRFRNKPYEIRVLPYLVVPGTTYNATAKVK